MKFNSVKEMEQALMKITNANKLRENIIFKSQGKLYEVQFLNIGTSVDETEAVYIGNETSTNMKVIFTGTGDAITVTRIKVNILS